MFEDEEILNEFVVESAEHLADIETQLLAMEAAGSDVDVDLVNTVFRGIHSIKGAAGFLGLGTINRLAHSLENVLNLMREQKLTPSSTTVDVMLRASDTLCGLIQNVAESNDADVSQHIEALDAIGTDADSGEAAGDPNASTSAVESDDDASTPSTEPGVGETVEPTVASQEERSTEVDVRPAVQPSPTLTAPAPATPVAATDSSIRVPVEALDQLMNLAGELVLGRNQLMQTVSTIEGAGLDTVAARLNQVTSELQDAIMQTRMQPVAGVFNRFTRVVRDLSNKLGKQCRLEIEGKNVEVDKTIIEAIADPLTHLVRNAVDHGLETPAQRVESGKTPGGLVRLRAQHCSGKVRIEVQDDGGGIDVQKLRRKAVERGLLTPEAARDLDDGEAARLIFHPGFSTAEVVSDVSGRGVGMDVVRTNIEKLGGAVEVDTVLGVGTTISITLPLTLAIIPSLIVQVEDDRFAIPQVNIAELVRVKADELAERIDRVRDAEVLRLRGTLLPLVRLRDAMGKQTARDELASNIVVVETGQQRYGLVVDRLHDSEEIVVKSLGRHLNDSPCLSGATILGDGRVALILDVPGIAAHMELRKVTESSQNDTRQDDVARESDETHSLLLFTNHPDEQFAVPMSVIARIDRIRAEQLDSVGGLQLLQLHGRSLPVLSLEDHTTAKRRADASRLHVIVFRAAGNEVGLLAPSLRDIRGMVSDVDASTLREAGFAGSMVIDEKATRLVDVYELTKVARPGWFDDEPTTSTEAQPTILVAEDSDFFRKQVARHLSDAGYTVVEAVDGLDAWNLLQAGELVDAVVTDVEMPNMTGFQLCRRVKADDSLADLPVIALTSLAGDEHLREGMDAGVDDYQVKMDREKLLTGLARLLHAKNRRPEPAVTEMSI